MSDGGMDPCECFWSHEVAMRRLLSLLRNSQTTCTDSECFDQLPGVGGGPTPAGDDTATPTLLMMFAWVAIALLMFLMRPRAVTDKRGAASFDDHNSGDDGRPPMPPPAVN